MDKVADLKKIIDAINLILSYEFGIGNVGEKKYACVGIKFLREHFNDFEWEIDRHEGTGDGLAFDIAYTNFAGIEFRASVSKRDIAEHNAHMEAIKKQETEA